MIFKDLKDGTQVRVATEEGFFSATILIDNYKTYIEYNEDSSVHEVTSSNYCNVFLKGEEED